MDLKEIFTDTLVLIYSILGIGFIIVGLFYYTRISLGWASILISLGIAFIAWGISRKSGILTKRIAEVSAKTEEMTKKLAKSALHETIGITEDRRLLLREKLIKITHKANTISDYIKKPEWDLDRQDAPI